MAFNSTGCQNGFKTGYSDYCTSQSQNVCRRSLFYRQSWIIKTIPTLSAYKRWLCAITFHLWERFHVCAIPLRTISSIPCLNETRVRLLFSARPIAHWVTRRRLVLPQENYLCHWKILTEFFCKASEGFSSILFYNRTNITVPSTDGALRLRNSSVSNKSTPSTKHILIYPIAHYW